MITIAITCRIFQPNESLEAYILAHIPSLSDGSILVVTSKIVSLSQGRIMPANPGEMVRLIEEQGEIAIKTELCYLTLKDGHWCPNAGIDESNADGKLVLWPEKPFELAQTLRQALMKKYSLTQLGILITDSRIYPLRAGVTGLAVAYAGFKGLRDYRGKPDIFGRPLRMTSTNIADTLASSAVLVMGEGDECQPLAVISEAPVEFVESVSEDELRIDPKQDLFRPVFEGLEEKGIKKTG